jgi:predicted DNA-binding ribbon-helix-helix protein
VSLEDDFWNGLREIAMRTKITISALAAMINQDPTKPTCRLIRVHVFRDYCMRSTT